tara:strand:- start:61 stop:1191 length:1131 start_codon:yes stop_codon:yes gene_type:complete
MAANGVIGITAQIMESTDLPGGKEQASPSMSIFQRITMGLKNIKKNFKSLVKNKSTGLLFLLLGSSQIARGLMTQVAKMIGFMLDILLAWFLPIIQWILINVTSLINVINKLLQDLEKWFKEIFNNIWGLLRDHAVSLWPGTAEIFGWKENSINIDTERDDLLLQIIPEVTTTDAEKYFEGALVEGGTIDPSYWNPDMDANLARPDYMGDTDAAGDANEKGRMSWIYQGGPSTPPGGYLDMAIQDETEAGNIQLTDRKVNADDKNEVAESWFSWADDISPFGWGDILEWAKDSAESLNVTPEDLSRYLFGTWESTSGEKAVEAILDKTIMGETDLSPDDLPKPGQPGNVRQAKNPQGGVDMQTSNLGFEEGFKQIP